MKKIFLIIMSVAFLASCDGLLKTSPSDQLSSSSMWSTESLADQGMAGLYRGFYYSDLQTHTIDLYLDGYQKQYWAYYEFQVGSSESLYGQGIIRTGTPSATDEILTYEWKWTYTMIHRVNDAIANLHKAGLTEAKYERYICEARFLRAWCYSRLNKIFGGVPIYLKPITDAECTKGQATTEEVWEVVLDDLDYCIASEYMENNTLGGTNYGRPSKGAAYSLRGYAYLYMAWQNGEDNSYYQLAANDFAKVSECGYGLWAGNYIDFFNYNNEKDHEMIFPIQYNEEDGYSDNFQIAVTGRDCYDGWSYIRPSYDFVCYFQNADGTKFDWTSRIPEWNDDVFVNDVTKREVFFLRDSISVSNGEVVQDYWDETSAGQIQERINTIGLDIFEKYYLKDGNEDRLRSCFNDRDPRLKDIILTPYDPYDCYHPDKNNGETMYNKELRWPYVHDTYTDGGDYYIGNPPHGNTYMFKKYAYHRKGEILERLRCPTDWPLIRYTDIYLLLAECYAHLGNLSGAVSIVNEIRARAGMPSVSVGSYDEVMEDIRYERRIELCVEGYDWFDEWRWGTYKDMKFQGKDVYGMQSMWGEWDGFYLTWYYSDERYPWSAPAEECERNPNMTRRAGWSY